MAEKEKSGPAFDMKTAVLVVAVLGGGAYLNRSPLQSSRPTERESLARSALGDQVVQARLWQDPFEVALAYREKYREQILQETASLATSKPADPINAVSELQADGHDGREGTSETNKPPRPFHHFGELAHQITRHEPTTTSPIAILEVLISGGSYAEDAEERHRARYAVLSALGIAGFQPWDAEHIGYAETPWPRGSELEKCPVDQVPALRSTPKHKAGTLLESTLIVPFEWFVPNKLSARFQSNSAVLVLWLNADAFEDHPLKRIAQLNQYLRTEINSLTNPPANQLDAAEHLGLSADSLERPARTGTAIQFKLLDPRLGPMSAELADLQGCQIQSQPVPDPLDLSVELAGLEIFSSWSTTADALLGSGSQDSIRSYLTNKPGWCGLAFHNVTCTDDELIEDLLEELALRGTDPSNGKDSVALISEWDTDYGRALPFTFAAMVKYRMNDRFRDSSFSQNLDGLERENGNPIHDSVLCQVTNDLFHAAQTPDARKQVLAKMLNEIMEKGFTSRVYKKVQTVNAAAFGCVSNRADLSEAKRLHLNRRLLEWAFPDAIIPNSLAAAVQELKTNTAAWPSNIIRWSYLRGVDGQVPGEQREETKNQKAAAKTKEESDKGDAGQELQRPEGHGQMDYVPRLAESLDRVERRFQARNQMDVKAIGVLGSDPYDKLLVLQSLRPRFTHELFFTTDLDARLLHPHELEWTRNVIVASSFGLDLRRRFQKDIPPFRDTYQTGRFLASLAALGYPGVLTNLPSLTPRLFEIGRKGAFDLSLFDSPVHPKSGRPDWKQVLVGEPNRYWWVLVGIGALLAFRFSRKARNAFGALLATVSKKETNPPAPLSDLSPWSLRLALWLPIILALWFGVTILMEHCSRQGEPFSWSDGLSLWPTEIIRLVAVGLALHLLLKSHADLGDQGLLDDELGRARAAKGAEEPGGPNRESRPGLWSEIFGTSILCWESPPPGDQIGSTNAKEVLLAQYFQRGRPGARLLRTLLPVSCYFVIIWACYSIFDPPFRPYRGSVSHWWDASVDYASLALLSLITFIVADASRLCQRFIENLSQAPPAWPKDRLEKYYPGFDLDDAWLSAGVDIQIIGQRTEVVGKLILYPFFILFLLIIARNHFFQRWDWPPSIILVLAVNSAYAVYAIWSLRRAAEKARTSVLVRLNKEHLRRQGLNPPAPTKRLGALVQQLESYEDGAFAPITRQPVIKAVLMPFGGAGVVTLLNFLSTKI